MNELAAARRFPDDSILLVGNSQTTGDNPITHQYNAFFIALLVDGSGRILDCGASVVLPLTGLFIRDLFVGRRLVEDEAEIVAEINARYYGSSRKAIVVAYKDALKKYRTEDETSRQKP